MRVWEFEDNKASPSDLVREQDFILRVRRMQRQSAPFLVLNFVLSAIEPLAKNTTALEAIQKQLQEFARVSKGVYSEMSNGDVFIEWAENGEVAAFAQRIIESILPEHKSNTDAFLLTYHMPKDYTRLRERTDHYVALVRAAAIVSSDAPAKVNDARGPLTAKSVDQIGQIINEIDLRHYGRTQNIYARVGSGWEAQGEEYFISIEDLRRERFPRLELASSEHFFLALCGLLDQRLLATLTTNYDTIGGKRINLNLSVASIMGGVFAHFVRRVPAAHRALIGFELNRGDLLQDFSLTLSAIEALKREGFRVAIDGITPDMVNYINLAAFPVDSIKINVSKERALQLADPAIGKGLSQLPAEKIIFFRCDNDRALSIGLDLGVTMFQGWLIDDLAMKKN